VKEEFQKIQNAFECLGNAEKRTAYDSKRFGKSGYASNIPFGQKRNARSDVTTQFAPPPKPPPTARRPKAQSQKSGPKLSAFSGVHYKTPAKPTDPAEAKRSNYEAWASMRPFASHATKADGNSDGKSQKPADSTAGSNHAFTEKSRVVPPPVPSRKTGYMPSTSGGDEPPAKNASAYNTVREKPDLPPRNDVNQSGDGSLRPNPTFARHTMDDDSESPIEARISTPYTTHGGERTNPFESASFRKSDSARSSLHAEDVQYKYSEQMQNANVRSNTSQAETAKLDPRVRATNDAKTARTRFHRFESEPHPTGGASRSNPYNLSSPSSTEDSDTDVDIEKPQMPSFPRPIHSIKRRTPGIGRPTPEVISRDDSGESGMLRCSR
jgi:hypothetical protein